MTGANNGNGKKNESITLKKGDVWALGQGSEKLEFTIHNDEITVSPTKTESRHILFSFENEGIIHYLHPAFLPFCHLVSGRGKA